MSRKQILNRYCLSQSLPYLKQGSTLNISSEKVRTHLRIKSQWRDDGQFSFEQRRRKIAPLLSDKIGNANLTRSNNFNNDSFASIFLTKHEDKVTSLGRADPHVSINVLDQHETEQLAHIDDGSNASNDNATKWLLSSFLVDEDKDYDDFFSGEEQRDGESCCLTLDVPDKINIECDLTRGGSIIVEGKIEGDVSLKTAQGNISVSKIRGHNIEIITGLMEIGKGKKEEGSPSSFIFVSDTLECESLHLSVPRPLVDRIRAKRIHAKVMNIEVGVCNKNRTASTKVPLTNEHKENKQKKKRKLDDDDSGAIIDISSLYIKEDANINVQQSASFDCSLEGKQHQAVRIKSHHGHVFCEVTARKPHVTNEMTGEILPLVMLGGVNGSCEVWTSELRGIDNNSVVRPTVDIGDNDNWNSCQLHFDSISPDSVSAIHANAGNVHVTVDRKVEADVRLFSPPSSFNYGNKSTEVDMETLLLDDNDDGNLADEILHMLQRIEQGAVSLERTKINDINTNGNNSNRIKIQTNAFTTRERLENNGLRYCEFVDGWIENTTSEPESRFDRKTRGVSGGGKIRLEEAQSQALHGFLSAGKISSNEMSSNLTFARPLLAVCSPGKIIVETLSWLGNIARRYGLDDTRKENDLGRQATRRKRLGKIPAD